jgi:hypothetical protein
MPTIYRPAQLLVPERLLADPTFLTHLRDTLDAIQLAHESPVSGPKATSNVRLAVRLVAKSGRRLDGPIDAWHALQALHVAAGSNPEIMEQMTHVSLSHLFFASTVSGHGLSGAPGMEGHHGDNTGRTPVFMPHIGPPQRGLPPGGRRAVVAVLDTGCGDHPWLVKRSSGAADWFVDDTTFAFGTPSPDSEVNGRVLSPLRGVLDSHSGHGSFISGLVRQLASDSRVLRVRLMTSDGVVDEAVLEQALWQLVQRVSAAQANPAQAGDFVDVVSMSFGGYLEDNPTLNASIGQPLQELSKLGVVSVASAGNDATAQRLYPAAFSDHPGWQGVPLMSVGALAGPASTAIFSNDDAAWVRTKYPGYAIVSTLPTTFTGSYSPHMTHPTLPREGYDPDGFTYGFGTWSGSSFATAIFAALLARTLPTKNPSMSDISPASATARANLAIADELGRARWP